MIATLPIRILLVEDNAGDARLLREYLAEARAERFDVVHVDRVAHAERELRNGFDLILLDLSLPDGAGLETVTRMLRVAPGMPVVVLTGTDDETLALRTVQAGAQDYLVKNELSTHLLVRTVRYAIERRKALEAERREAEAASVARRSRFLAEGGRALAASLDFDTLLRTIGRLVVPALGDVCVVDLVDGRDVSRHVVGVGDRVDAEMAFRLGRYAPTVDDVHHPCIAAMRSGEVAVLQIDEAVLGRLAFGGAEHRRTLAALDVRTVIIVPLQARGRVFGALAVAQRQAADGDARSLLEELAQHAALALDNALLFRREQQAVRAREDMVSVVSHDLRNPLNVVTMTAALLKRELGGTPTGRYVERIERSVEQMLRLINDLLDVARIESGTFAIEAGSQSPASLIGAAVELFRPLATSRSLAMVAVASDQLPPVHADRGRVLQLLSNLVGNAIKFTPSGGRIELTAHPRDGAVRFEVRDSGPGIAPEHHAKVFDRFWQARRSDGRGAGLGLAIAKAIVDAHGGAIGVDSHPGAGACFHFTLPFATAAAHAGGPTCDGDAPAEDAIA